jgi:predicted AAA+ superfamily ATPase
LFCERTGERDGYPLEQIAASDILRRLEFDNPWWAFRSGTRVRFRQPPQRGFARDFAARALDAKLTVPLIAAGPPGAGKTIVLRQTLAAVVRAGVSPMRIAYLSLGAPVFSGEDLAALADRVLDRFAYGRDEKVFLFLDDLDYAADGPAQLAALQKRLPNARLIAALASGAPRLTSGLAEIESGGGAVEIHVLPPLSFAEFMGFRRTDAGGVLPEAGTSLALDAARMADLNGEFARYLTFGGFPSGIAAKREDESPPALVRDALLHDVLHRDLAAFAGVIEPRELGRLFAVLARNTGAEAAIEDLAKATGVAKNTLRKYLDFLEGSFLIRRVPRLNRDGRPFQRQVLFKIYLTSPTLYTALFGPVAPDAPEYARLVETAVVSQCFATGLADHLAYASWKGGMVDLVLLDKPDGRPDQLFQFDWSGAVVASDRGPDTMVNFAVRTNPDARMTVLTRGRGGPARRGGLDLTLVPAALYAYWLGTRKA